MRNVLEKLLVAVLVIPVTGAVFPAYADTTLYSTGFETPTFTPGAIAGQNGWNTFGSGTPVVENTFAFAGSQAVFVNGGTDQSGPYYALSSNGPLIQYSLEIAIFTSTTETSWQVGATGPSLTDFLGGIDIDSNTSAIHAITSGFPIIGTFTRATTFDSTAWHNVSFLFDIATQSYDISIDGLTLDSGVPFCGSNGSCTAVPVASLGDVTFDSFGIAGGGNDSGYMDNVSVTLVSTPEPSSIGMLLCGFALAAMIAGRACVKSRNFSRNS